MVTNEQTDMKHADSTTDLLIIGAGPGGYVAAIYAAKNGLDVTLVERGKLGGTCLNIGCIPTKTLIKSSELCHNAKNSEQFGIEIDGSINVNMKQVVARKDEVTGRLVSGVEYLMKKNKIKVISGEASFANDKTVHVNEPGTNEPGTNEPGTNEPGTLNNTYTIHAKDIIIATGSKISNVNIPGIDLPFVLNSTTALELTHLPESITIIGGGVIGMEFAFMYNNFGVDVHVVEFLDRTLNMVDKDISREIQRVAKREKIKIHTGSKVTEIRSNEDGKAEVIYEDKKGQHTLVSEKVLVAIGRDPNIDGLALENTGVNLNENKKGINVDDSMKTNIEHIYGIGDVTNKIQLAHAASRQGIIAVDSILNKETKMNYNLVPNVIFTSPEIATVGVGEDAAKEEKIDITVSKIPFTGNGKALAMNETRGFVKLIKNNETGKIIGGSIIGPDASTLIGSLAIVVTNGLTETELNKTVFPHPTTSEVIQEASEALGLGAIHS